jgi:2-polyprenyl-3-methyl-5-hydroxy-6-metoxy-1,4-benzoquinol methylase
MLVNEHWLRYEFVSQFIQNKRVLDLACGSGYGSNYLAKSGALEVIGGDLDTETIADDKKRYQRKNLIFQEANGLSLIFADNYFDVIVSLETIEHFSEHDQTRYLKELKRVLKPGGLLIVSTPNSEFTKHKNPWHLKELNEKELRDILFQEFINVNIYRQGSALTTFIQSPEEIKTAFKITSDFKERYYIALASDESLVEVNRSLASINPSALERKENNIINKFIDKIYYKLNKKLFFKKIFAEITKISQRKK